MICPKRRAGLDADTALQLALALLAVLLSAAVWLLLLGPVPFPA